MKNSLQDRIKSVLLSRKLEVDHDEMRDLIFSELPKEEKRRKGFILFFLAFIILFGSIMGVIYWHMPGIRIVTENTLR